MDETQPIQTDDSTSGLPAGQADVPTPAASSPAGANGSVVANGSGATEPATGGQENPATPEDEFQLPENDDDLHGMAHTRQGQNLIRQREHLRKLSADLKAAREEREQLTPWNAVKEQYGDAAAVSERLAQLSKLDEYERDEQGQLVRDPQTGLPRLTARGFVETLAQTSRPTVDRLYQSIWTMPVGEDGTTYGEQQFTKILQNLGVTPEAFMAFAQSGGQVTATAASPKSTAATRPATAEELQDIPPEFHEAFQASSAKERERMLFEYDDEERLEALSQKQAQLQRDAELNEIKQRQQQYEQREAQERQQYEQTFVRETQAAQAEHFAGVRQEFAEQIETQLAQEWQPTTDPAANKVLYGYAINTVFNLLSDEHRGMAEAQLARAGVQIEADTYQLLDDLTEVGSELVLRQRLKNDARLASQHDPAALHQAEQRYDQLKKRIQARAVRYARDAAKPLMNQLASVGQSQNAALQQATQVRPALNGRASAANTPSPQFGTIDDYLNQRYGK